MHGNELEWCADWFVQYSLGDAREGDGLRVASSSEVEGSFKVARGGSHRHAASEARVSYRYYENPKNLYYFIGVRPARALDR